MSVGSPRLARRERAIEATRRRLRRLEIEAHRIKAELARLEAEYEDDVADWLSRKLRRRSPASGVSGAGTGSAADATERSTVSRDVAPTATPDAVPVPAVLRFSARSQSRAPLRRRRTAALAQGASDAGAKAPQVVTATVEPSVSLRGARPHTAVRYRKSAPPILLSFALHAAALLLCLSFTFATLVQQSPTLLAMPADLHETAEEFSEVEIEPTRFDDSEVQNVVYVSEEFSIVDTLFRELEPAELGAGTQPLGDVGQLDALPSDLGMLLAGAGDTGSGAPGGPPGAAIFFGARAQGDRFVFVVDNSKSMRDGRFDAAMAELVRTIDALGPRQSFYVIFVSDRPYPMFFPEVAPALLLATPANKKRLAEWLPKALLADGRNRELPKAMDMAAALQPHAVFLLWDSDWRYHEPARADVMTQLARPNQWNFSVHTIGLGVSSRDAEHYLSAIANAHGGTYRTIDVPRSRAR